MGVDVTGRFLAFTGQFHIFRAVSGYCLFLLCCGVCTAEEPLHQRIDHLVESRFEGEPAAVAGDAEFFRRVNLDLAGCIPTSDATREFIADKSPDKRQAAIKKLLAAPEYATRMANLFHVMLMERRGDNPEWDAFLQNCFAENKPWDVMVREILHPVREDEKRRGAAYFYTQRLQKVGAQMTDHPGLTRDVGRMFLGVDLQCAQCHDHLTIEDYSQRDFQGLYAVFQNVSIRREKFPAINEKAMTQRHSFISVFGSNEKTTGPRLPFQKEFALPEPPAEDPEPKKKKKPDPNAPPSFSALEVFAKELPTASSELFRQNIANRLWFCMMGRGLVEPLDQFHRDNEPTHPAVLKLLADELAKHDFDIKWLLQQLAMTRTYQRSSRVGEAETLPPPGSYRIAHQRPLTAEQIFASVLQATGNRERFSADARSKDEGDAKAYDELKSRFVKAFATEPKTPAVTYAPAVKQALFLLNDSQVLDLLQPHKGNLTARVSKLKDEEIAAELYLSIFSRLPSAEEEQVVQQYLQEQQKNRPASIKRLAWAMLSSMEFAVNH